MSWLLNLLFGCRHRHRSWPRGTRQTCLDCGKRLPCKIQFAAVETARAERSARG